VRTEEDWLDASELTTGRRQTMAAAVFAVFGNLAGAVLTSLLYGGGGGFGNSLRYGHAALSLVVLVMLWIMPPSRALILRLFATLTVPILPLLVVWTLAVPEVKLGESFIAFKMVLMGVALLTPLSLWLGMVLLVAFSIETVVLWALNLAGHLSGEPWVTLFYGVFAAALLWQRASERRLTRRLVQVNAEASALERVALASLAVRDRMNTPLQTLTLSIELLEAQEQARQGGDGGGGSDGGDGERARAGTPEIVARMRRAMVKLTELSHRLEEEEGVRRRGR
jgi:hypothetical protein